MRWLTDGGSTFQESTMNGIFNLKDKIAPDDTIVISFGVSPMTTDEIIDLFLEGFQRRVTTETGFHEPIS